jgi:uncharacterized RDD family membrane protein YckC
MTDPTTKSASARRDGPEALGSSRRLRPFAANDGTQVPRKVHLARRFLAFAIDLGVAILLSVIPLLGSLLGALYLLLRDGSDLAILDRRSIGKRLLRLRPVCDDRSPVTLLVSARRNWMLALTWLAVFLGLIPVLGFAIKPVGMALGIILVILEGYLVFVDDSGVRSGDHLAGTRVVEARP